MPNPSDIFAAPKTCTYAAIAVANSIKTSIATAVTQQTYTGGALNGTTGAAALTFPQTISATTSSHASSYLIGTAITITGTDYFGAVQTDTITLTQVNGGETVFTTKAFLSVTSIVVPPMNDTSGAFTFGVNDIIVSSLFPVRQLRAGAAGNIAVGYQGGITDTLPCLQGERQDVLAVKVLNSGTTALPVTVYA